MDISHRLKVIKPAIAVGEVATLANLNSRTLKNLVRELGGKVADRDRKADYIQKLEGMEVTREAIAKAYQKQLSWKQHGENRSD